MADLTWVGAVGTDSTNINNWHDEATGVPPIALGATDYYYLKGDAIGVCSLNHQVLGHLIIKLEYNRHVVFNHATPTFIAISFYHGLVMHFPQAGTTFTSTGTQPTGTPFYNQPLIVGGDLTYASGAGNNGKETTSWEMVNGQSTAAYLPDGDLGNMTLTSGKWSTNVNPNAANIDSALDHVAADSFGRLQVGIFVVANPTWVNTQVSLGTAQKHIHITGLGVSSGLALQCTIDILDFSNCKLTLDAKNSAPIPCTNDITNFGANTQFIAKLEDVVIGNGNGNGNIITIPAGLTLQCSSLEIKSGSMLLGSSEEETAISAKIECIEKPIIRGTWNFEEISDGVYRTIKGASSISTYQSISNEAHIRKAITMTATTISSAAANQLWVNSADSNKLYFGTSEVGGGGGLIDSTGIVFTPQATNPETTNPLDTIWINSETGHLMRGDRDTESIIHINVRNDEGATIPLGAPLYSKGEIGGSERILVGIADANDPAKMPCMGIAMEEMDTSGTKDSNCITQGIFNSDITGFTGLSVGDTLYVSNTAGLTKTRPTGSSDKVQNVGIVLKTNGTTCQGLLVSAIGRSNDIPNGVITTNSADADYVYIDDGNTFKKITPSDLGIGGGGGSGTVTSVATTAPITGGTITTTGTIGISAATTSAAGSMSGADKTKLDGIEASADVTDATNVTAAGALMDSEVTNLADVKAFDPADYATAGQGATADAALPKAGGTMTGEIEATTITLNAVPADPATDNKVRIGESGGTGEDGNNMFMIRTNDGYLQLGPNNSGYAHMQTDRDRFYFNKALTVAGGYYLAYSGGLTLGTGTSVGGATAAITVADASPDITVAGTTTSIGFIKTGGAPTEFLMADGSVTSPAPSTFEYARLFANAHMPNQSDGSRYYMPFANASYWTLQTTASNHPNITVTNATTDYITLSKGGVYQIVGSFEFFGTTSITGNMDMWMEFNTNSSANRNLGTARNKQSYSSNTGAWNAQKTIVIEILSTEPDIDLYVSAFCNGNGFAIMAYDDNRTNITITRLGDSVA